MNWIKGTEQECLQADAIVSANCGWPNGNTQRWAIPRQCADGDYAIPYPQGSHGFTAEQMRAGLDGFNIVKTVEFPEVVDA